jgi:hypothetical protein
VFGGTALYAYEFAACAPVPSSLADEDRLFLLLLRSDLDAAQIGATYCGDLSNLA